ncbi:MAG: hypothetical protein WCI83_09900 [Thermoleophilia bacterium]
MGIGRELGEGVVEAAKLFHQLATGGPVDGGAQDDFLWARRVSEHAGSAQKPTDSRLRGGQDVSDFSLVHTRPLKLTRRTHVIDAQQALKCPANLSFVGYGFNCLFDFNSAFDRCGHHSSV